MHLQPRPYAGLADLQKMKALIVEGRKVYPHSGYPHIGDLDWWLFYGAFVNHAPFEETVTLWENGEQLMAWTLAEKKGTYDAAVHPSLRDTEAAFAVHDHTQAQIESRLRGSEFQPGAFVCADEAQRRERLEGRGYVGQDYFTCFMQPLDRDLPTPLLPEGFCFIEAMRPEWVERRADVHFDAFSPSRMTAEAYAHFMTAPNYDPSLDVVIAAPDETFAAFAMCWIDPQTGIGNFEPVGTRSTMQRKGLGKAALLEGMRRMRARGMTVATVLTHTDSAGNIAFYGSAGFQPVTTILKYEKIGQ
ncbi:MAG: GNAT family N-acetyltransferase [Anaerolineae bacterium]|nr:GNAT family N-acetyltransferase [Anaerolineae bacterium]